MQLGGGVDLIRLVERIGRLLAAFEAGTDSYSLGECAAAAQLSKSSAHRLLVSLEQIGLVERSGTGWRLGPRTVFLAAVRLGQLDLRREAGPMMAEIGRMFRAATAFAVPDGCDMVYIERRESPEPFGPAARLGSRAPIWAGASGKAVLSRLDAVERTHRLSDNGWRSLTQDLRDSVIREVEAASTRGYAIDRGSFFEGVAGVAVALCDHHGLPVAAMSAIVPTERLTDALIESVGEKLMTAAASLERLMSLTPT